LDSKGAKVDNEQNVQDIEDEERVFLFDRMSFSSKTKSQILLKTISDEFQQLELKEVIVYNLPDDIQKKIRNNELLKYTQQFYVQLLQAEVGIQDWYCIQIDDQNVLKYSENRRLYCYTKSEEMKIQNDSISVALYNLEGHAKSSSASLKKFKER